MMSGVGLSQVNFDVQTLEDDEEQQLEKEDEERERELHELLSNELPEDLLDDDNCSFSSQGLGNSSRGRETPDFNPELSFEHRNDVQDPDGQRGIPYYQHEHALLTRRGEEFIQRSGFARSTESGQSVNAVGLNSVPDGYEFGGSNYGYDGDMQDYNAHVDDGRTYLNQNLRHDGQDYVGRYDYQLHSGKTRVDQDDNGKNVGSCGNANGDEHYLIGDYSRMEDYGYSLVDSSGTGISGPVFHSEEAVQRPPYAVHDQNFNVIHAEPGDVPRSQQQMCDVKNRPANNGNFKVHYTRNRSVGDNDGQVGELEDEGSNSVLHPSSELAQLQVLHRARGRKLEELTRELAAKENEYERQIRLLNHHLALTKGERDGMAASLKHSQEIACSRKNEVEELERKLQNADVEKERLNTEKGGTESELEAAKKTIESLHQQLMELEKSESLSRAREQHENIVIATRKRHEEEIVRLKQKLDDVSNSLMWKNEESKRLHDELCQARKEADRVRLDRAETVNRLTKSLEQSQKQNEDLLKAGSTQEISHLQSLLHRAQREKEELQQHYKTIEVDLVDLKEQLRIYESVSKLGVNVGNETTLPLAATDGVKRNLEADEWRTPGHGDVNQAICSTEEALSGLQKELQHSLASNRSKREEIQQLRAQLDDLKRHLTTKEDENERLELLVKKQEKRVLEQEKKVSDLEELRRDPEQKEDYRESELRKLRTLVEEHRAKLEECVKREKEMEQRNIQLKSQMSEMVREYDEDKQKNIEQCRESCLAFHDEAMNTMKGQLNQQYEEQATKLRRELQSISSELHQAKESFVVLSEESRWIEKQTRERCEEESKRKLEELRVQWDQAKSYEMAELRQTVVTEMERNFGKEKLSWRKSEEDLMKGKLQTELALAKMDWTKEQQKLREEAVQTALSMAEKEWLAKYDRSDKPEGWSDKINDMKRQWEEEKEKRMEVLRKNIQENMASEHSQKLDAARQEWERLKTIEIEQEVEKAKKKWDEDLKNRIEEAVESGVTTAKTEWLTEQADVRRDEISRVIEEAKAEALVAARKEGEDEKKAMDMRIENIIQSEKLKWRETADEERTRSVDTAVLLAEEKWQSEHQDKVIKAVAEALQLAQATWKKERETAIESAVSESLHSAKASWNENKVREIEQILSSARKQWFAEFDLTKQESATSPTRRKSNSSFEETNKTFSYLEAQYSKNLKEFRETELQKVLEEKSNVVKELETKHEMEMKKQKETYQVQLEEMTKKSQENRKEELKQLETEYKNKLQHIMDEIEEKWRLKKAALEVQWTKKFEEERSGLEGAYREKYETEREKIGREMQDKYEKAVEQARKKMEDHFDEQLRGKIEATKHDWEEEQEEERMALEEQHLKKLESEQERLRREIEQQAEMQLSQVKNDALSSYHQLEQLLKDEKVRYRSDIENLQKELRDLKKLRIKPDDEVLCDQTKTTRRLNERSKASQTEVLQNHAWISLAELSEEESNDSKLQELRQQYLATTAQLKEDLKQHAIETRKHAARALRTEVLRERHATSKRLRRYYLECLKQILDDDKEGLQNNRIPRSSQEKMKVMEERLRLPDEKEETFKSQESSLTTVTDIPDDSFDKFPVAIRPKRTAVSDTVRLDTKPRPVSHVINQGYPNVHGDTSGDEENGRLRSPRNSTAESNKSRTEQHPDIRANRNDEWVNFSRGDKHPGVFYPELNQRALRGSKAPSKNAQSDISRRVLTSSTESLLSFDPGGQLDLPGAINFSQQAIPSYLQRPEQGNESDTSNCSGISGTSRDNRTNEKYLSNDVREHSKRLRKGAKEKSERVQFYKHDERQRKTRMAQDSSRQVKPHMGHATDISPPQLVLAKKTGNERPTKLSSSFPKQLSDVLPSKPLSPVTRAPPKFSYTMHSQSVARNEKK